MSFENNNLDTNNKDNSEKKFKVGSEIFYKNNKCIIIEKKGSTKNNPTYSLRIVGESDQNPPIVLTQEEMERETSTEMNTESVFCPFCGKKQNAGIEFCGFCGEKIPSLEDTNELIDSPDAGELMDKALKNIARINSVEKEVKLTDEEFNKILGQDGDKWSADIKIFKLNLESMLPPEFNNLTPEQKQKVLQDSKRRIVDIVKADAQTQYSLELKERAQKAIDGDENSSKGKIATTWRRMKSSIKSSFTKERDLKNTENEVYLKLINSEEGKKIIQENLQRLTEIVGKQKVHLNYKGETYIDYLNVYSEIPANIRTEEQEKIYNNFAIKAEKFSNMPYEWGQEENKKLWGNKKKYDALKAEYENARNEVLKIKEQLKGKEVALTEMLEIDNAIRLEQLLNTHPEFEKALNDFSKTAGGKETIKNGLSILNTATGKNMINRGLVAGGALIRGGAKVLPWMAGASAGVATLSTAIAAPVAGGFIGFYRGKFRAQETLQERQKEARYGQKDESAEKVATVDATRLTMRLQDLVNEISLLDGEQKAKKLASLAVRIEHSIGKIEKGQVNFGNAKSSLVNQFNLVNALNQAVALKELNSTDTNIEVKNRIESLLKNVGENVAENTSKAQKSFVRKQAWKGALLGGGLAGIGYGVRYLTENLVLSTGAPSTKEGVISKNTNTGTNTPSKTPSGINKETPAVKSSPTSTPKLNETETSTPKPSPTKTPDVVDDSAVKNIDKTPAKVENFVNKGITIERGGSIKAITNLQNQLKTEYPDISKAPQNIQDFVNADPTKKAIELGFYDPTKKAESALIQKGSVLKFDSNGKLLFGKPDADGNIAELGDKYTGKMIDSDRPKIIEERPKIRKIRQNIAPKIENVKIPKSTDTIDVIDSKSTEKITTKTEVKLSDTPKEISPNTIVKEQAPIAAMDAPVTNSKPTPAPKSSPTPEEISKEIKTQIELTEKYPQFKGTTFAKNSLNIPEEKLVETYKVYEENIKQITKGGSVEDFKSKAGNSPASNYIEAKSVEGDLVTPYVNKIANLANEIPDYNPVTGDETLHHFIERCILKLTKEGKLEQIKDLKLK